MAWSLLLSGCFILLAQGAYGQMCNQHGECTGGNFISTSTVPTSATCLETCRNTTNCEYYTYFQDTDRCDLYVTCPLSDNSCTFCESGQPDCDYRCDFQGQCADNTAVAIDTSSSKEECVMQCQANSYCEFWSYDPAGDGTCVLYRTCDTQSTQCSTCLSGVRQCSPYPPTTPPPPVPEILLIVGGIGGGFSAEAFDMSGQGRTCEAIPTLPDQISNHIGVTNNGVPVICGNTSPTEVCFMFKDKTWQPFYDNMTDARRHASAVQLNDGDFLVLGGGDTYEYSGDLYTDAVQQFSSPVNLPQNLTNHCSGRINDTHFFVSGGYTSTGTVGDLWIYSIPDQAWSQKRSMNTARHFHGCATISTSHGIEILVAGGYEIITSTEIYNIELDLWRNVGVLPQGNRGMSFTQFGDTALFTGGYAQPLRTAILEFDVDNEVWITRSETLDTPRYAHSGVLVHDDIVTCT